MDVLLSSLDRLSGVRANVEKCIDVEYEEHDKRLIEFLNRANSLVSNPKRTKKLAQIPVLAEDAITDRQSNGSEPSILELTQTLRPVRTAKTKASENLKEPTINGKMRNDNNVVVKKEKEDKIEVPSRSSSSAKPQTKLLRGKSSDEGISSLASEKENNGPHKRNNSNSVEIILTKAVQIDLCDDEDNATEKMPPPMLPITKVAKKPRTRQKKEASANDSTASSSSTESTKRATRSKIKKEPVEKSIQEISDVTVSEESDNGGKKRLPRTKKTHKPIIIKVEPEEEIVEEIEPVKVPKKPKSVQTAVKIASPARSEQSVYEDAVAENIEKIIPALNANDTFNVPASDETFNIPSEEIKSANVNETVILEKNVLHDSIMTEDNDEEMPLAVFKIQPTKFATLPARPELKPKPTTSYKKGEVFNVFEKSPVKKKVEAFEKHAIQSMNTPEKSVGMVRGALAKQYLQNHGKVTPAHSKIALPLSKSNTPSNQPIKPVASSSAISAYKVKPLTKKLLSSKSLSSESLDDVKKMQMNDEKRKARDEKARMVQLKREQLEKETADNAMKALKERDEKFARIMQEKEEKQRAELLKKKALKDKQERKYQEELKRKEKMALIEQNKRENAEKECLQKSMHKQIIQQKIIQQKKEESKNAYNFDMLNTDDSTDDEAKPVSQKRPPPPAWSKNPERKKTIEMQTYINSRVIDTLFSVHPLSVDLKEIFPKIDERKLIRNSSAVWRTPPRMSQVP